MKAGEREALAVLQAYTGRPLRIMEVCGTHTHEIFRLGIRSLLPERIALISGPGCPVCVTGAGYIDAALTLAAEYGATVTTFGDLMRVPGSDGSLQEARAAGAKAVVVYSPLDALAYAEAHPAEEVVFLSVGFETTTPAECLSVLEAKKRGVTNFSLLTANKTMPAAYRAMAGSTDAFLYPGHVHAVTGTGVLRELKAAGISGVCAGFTAQEILTALALIVQNAAKGAPFFVNAYPRVVTEEGSAKAGALVRSCMEPCRAYWRGIGFMEDSGMRLQAAWAPYDAEKKFSIDIREGKEHPACCCGSVLRGETVPPACPLFGKACTDEHPVGACMVSGEGACAAYYRYGSRSGGTSR